MKQPFRQCSYQLCLDVSTRLFLFHVLSLNCHKLFFFHFLPLLCYFDGCCGSGVNTNWSLPFICFTLNPSLQWLMRDNPFLSPECFYCEISAQKVWFNSRFRAGQINIVILDTSSRGQISSKIINYRPVSQTRLSLVPDWNACVWAVLTLRDLQQTHLKIVQDLACSGVNKTWLQEGGLALH